MSVKDDVRAMLQSGDERALAAAVAADPRVARTLVARLWDTDAEMSRRAALGLGEGAACRPELAREIVRRLLWALNDESGTNGRPALAGLGEIGRRAPGVIAPFVSALVQLAEDEGLRLDLLKALTAIACTAPGLVAPHEQALERSIDRSRPDERDALAALRRALANPA